MSKVLAVFGATGQQGSSVVNHVLDDPELSQQYKIRAITRDVDSEKSKKLKEKVEVVQGDSSEPSSLKPALKGAHTVFILTTPSFTPDGVEVEYNSAKAMADAAVEAGAEYIIFSTLPSAKELSGGKYPNVTHFEAKANAEKYIRALPIKSAFFAAGFYMQNFQGMPMFTPQKGPDGSFVIARPNSPKSKMPMIDAVGDTGKFVGAILAEPAKYEGTTFCASTALYSLEEQAAIMSKATGKNVVYKQVSMEEFLEQFPFGQDVFRDGFSYPSEFGYYGPDTEKLVAWAAENARGKPTTFEEFLEANPIQLG